MGGDGVRKYTNQDAIRERDQILAQCREELYGQSHEMIMWFIQQLFDGGNGKIEGVDGPLRLVYRLAFCQLIEMELNRREFVGGDR